LKRKQVSVLGELGENLTRLQRQVIVMRLSKPDDERWSYRRAARDLGIPEAVVRNAHDKGLLKIAARLSERGGRK
jgi:DNA-directed RNA polymerase specialized sigma24 family protein